MAWKPTPHPTLPVPTPAQAMAMGADEWRKTMVWREKIIAQERANPFRAHEPPIWTVCDALLNFEWANPANPAEVRAEQERNAAIRHRLGFTKPISVLLILGGNRGGKTQYASHRTMRLLRLKPGRKALMFHQDLETSRTIHQARMYALLPPDLKAAPARTASTYVAYKQQTGFGPKAFTLPPEELGQQGSECVFKSYEQDPPEGGEMDVINADELVPLHFVKTLRLRLATRAGRFIITFTPIKGYTETVRQFLDGSQIAMESTAFLLPKDGGEPDLARALGLENNELDELWNADREGRAATAPQSRPEQCLAWLTGEQSQPKAPESRTFARVPRVLRCVDPECAVVYFHSSDNPYGNPKQVWNTIAAGTESFIKERFYGIATKNITARFTKFNLAAHLIHPGAIPREGTNYLFVDPCRGRNLFMHWYRVTPQHVYLYREWPGSYIIPGVGWPGPWAVPEGTKPDGERGPAQQSFGWGLRQYKLEIARLEGWKALKDEPDKSDADAWADWVDALSPEAGADQSIEDRYIDSRFATAPTVAKDRPKTLLTEFEEIGLFFKPTPGDDIAEGVHFINDALDYDTSRPVDSLNCPRLLVASDCANTIYALQNWTGLTASGKTDLDGACKDPIDLLRYFFMSDCPYMGTSVKELKEEDEAELAVLGYQPRSRRYY
jgi:hypothetical protein